jgi:HprK-related kinase B
MSIPTRAGLVRQLLTSREFANRLTLCFSGCVIELRSDSPALVAALQHYFRPFVADAKDSADIRVIAIESPPPELALPFVAKEPDPGKTKIKEECVDLNDGRVVRKRLTGMVFVFGGEDNLALGPCLDNSNQVVNFVNNRFIAWQLEKGCLLGHAAAVQQHKRGLAIAGISGAGKSTLALHMMSRGTIFTSNDRLLIRQTNKGGIAMCGVAKLPRINPGTALNNPDLTNVIPIENIEYFSCLSSKELWNLEHKYDVYLDECFGKDRFVLEGPTMAGLVILNWHHDEEAAPFCRVVDIDKRHDLLPAFMKSPGLFYLPPEGEPFTHSAAEYAAVLRHTTVMEFGGGVDFKYASAICHSFLATGKVPENVENQKAL